MTIKHWKSAKNNVAIRYNKPAIFMHWAIFLLVVIAYVTINLRGPEGSDTRETWIGIHVWAGLLVFGLALVRTGWRFSHSPPVAEPSPTWMKMLANAAHIALYAFVIVQPMLGVLIFNLEGHPVMVVGFGWTFSVIGANAALAPLAKEARELVGNIFYYVIGMHALAALWHHYILRDNTLRRML